MRGQATQKPACLIGDRIKEGGQHIDLLVLGAGGQVFVDRFGAKVGHQVEPASAGHKL
jgi:hypothetical protein